MVEKAFTVMDRNGDGTITASDLARVYDASSSKDVMDDNKSPEQVTAAFLHSFEGKKGNRDGIITLQEFTNYYANLSASIDLDEYFVDMMGAYAVASLRSSVLIAYRVVWFRTSLAYQGTRPGEQRSSYERECTPQQQQHAQLPRQQQQSKPLQQPLTLRQSRPSGQR